MSILRTDRAIGCKGTECTVKDSDIAQFNAVLKTGQAFCKKFNPLKKTREKTCKTYMVSFQVSDPPPQPPTMTTTVNSLVVVCSSEGTASSL